MRHFIIFTMTIYILFIAADSGRAQAQCSAYNKESEQPTGYLIITTVDLDSFYVVLDSDFDTVLHCATGDTLALNAGQQRIRIMQKYHYDDIFNWVIRPDSVRHRLTRLIPMKDPPKTKLRSGYARIYWGGNTVVLTDHDSRLYAGDDYMGTGLAILSATETYRITAVGPGGKTLSRSFKPSKRDFAVGTLFHRPGAKESRTYALIPGASQIYKRQYLKGAVFITGFAVASTFTYDYNHQKNARFREYENTLASFVEEPDPLRALELKERAEALHTEYRNLSRKRNYMLAGTIAIYALNVIDGFIPPKIGFRDDRLIIDPYLDFQDESLRANIGFQARF
jgi:hypothetical protein